ncbi:MAG: DoxX family protein, partial [Nitriliruptoraceae bacterium]
PAATRIAPRLTPLAASGLVLLMLFAAVWHATRGEVQSIVGNLVVAVLLGVIAYVRTRVHAIEPR